MSLTTCMLHYLLLSQHVIITHQLVIIAQLADIKWIHIHVISVTLLLLLNPYTGKLSITITLCHFIYLNNFDYPNTWTISCDQRGSDNQIIEGPQYCNELNHMHATLPVIVTTCYHNTSACYHCTTCWYKVNTYTCTSIMKCIPPKYTLLNH